MTLPVTQGHRSSELPPFDKPYITFY